MSAPVAIITGASHGIGAGLVAGYRQAGYAVVGVALSPPSSDGDDHEWVAIAGDIADVDTARRAVDAAVDRFGRIDTLINNAGIYIGKPFTDYTLEDYVAITAVNLTGFFHITQLAIVRRCTSTAARRPGADHTRVAAPPRCNDVSR
jgi:NAD(P)-dependent dehydrogenase (short-subunit alcohol dehydrogenase family)